MFDSLTIARDTIRTHVRALDPDVLDPAHAIELVDFFAELKNLAAAGEALCAGRVAATNAWQRSGERSASDWLAKRSGTSVGAARAALDTAKHVSELPATDAAFRSGALSGMQADAIADAAAADPDAEAKLLGMAQTQPLTKLRDECARVKAAATPDPKARHERIHRHRFFRTWNDPDGARCGMYKMTPDLSAIVESAIKPFADAAFKAARVAGVRESSEAYAADGLVAMARASSGDAAAVRPARREAIVIVNLESLHRDAVERGEICEIPGVGPIPVSVARDLLGDALLRIVIRDGVDIRTEVHAGRLASDAQRTAIQVRQNGRCLRPTCAQAIAQIDHTLGFSITGATPLDQLGGLCKRDHDLKTYQGHTYRHTDGGWHWVQPDGTIEHERPPPA